MERGVVALPFEVHQRDQGFITGDALSALQLNYFALYWDKITIPKNIFFGMQLPNEDVFEEVGLLTRPLVDVGSVMSVENFPRIHLSTQAQVTDHLRKVDKSTAWSIHQTGDNSLLFADQSVSKETVRLELENLLPVPGPNVAIHEILEFKHRRKDELQALHSYCDELYFEIINSGDPTLQAAKTFTKLKQAISDLEKLNVEGWRSPIKFDLDISPEFDLSDIRAGIATILGAFSSPHVLETVTAGAVIAVLEGFVKIKPRLQSMRNGANTNLAYISKARVEGVYK
ncbi:hypothetical protein GNG27_17655 [Leclercia sp. 119287]|uniref:DUF6236 family protein n=1 Tax=Leclercia sp. 119287 TaxID=2681308 RepID=UPI0012E1D779|nr:DUF6236 family protein [Leclercia sp. 119287]QGU16397.1 hypothetical protein GNG27_17655 [Leclercia sp. 119287]